MKVPALVKNTGRMDKCIPGETKGGERFPGPEHTACTHGAGKNPQGGDSFSAEEPPFESHHRHK